MHAALIGVIENDRRSGYSVEIDLVVVIGEVDCIDTAQAALGVFVKQFTGTVPPSYKKS